MSHALKQFHPTSTWASSSSNLSFLIELYSVEQPKYLQQEEGKAMKYLDMGTRCGVCDRGSLSESKDKGVAINIFIKNVNCLIWSQYVG